MTLGGIVEERGAEQVAIVMPAAQQALNDVQAMPAIRDRHPLEEGNRALGQNSPRKRRLFRPDSRPNVGHELTDPMHRSAPA